MLSLPSSLPSFLPSFTTCLLTLGNRLTCSIASPDILALHVEHDVFYDFFVISMFLEFFFRSLDLFFLSAHLGSEGSCCSASGIAFGRLRLRLRVTCGLTVQVDQVQQNTLACRSAVFLLKYVLF